MPNRPSDGLTEKQRRFVQNYLITGNGTQSAIDAGYSPRTAQEIASENLTKPMIQKAMASHQAATQARTEVTVDFIIQALVSNYRAAMSLETPQIGAANKALELLGKQIGMFVDRSLSVQVRQSLPALDNLSYEQLRELLSSMPQDVPKSLSAGESDQ